MSTSNPNNDWLKSLTDTLWQIRMVSQETGGIFNSVVDTGLKLLQKVQALTAAITALTALYTRVAGRGVQRETARQFVRLQGWAAKQERAFGARSGRTAQTASRLFGGIGNLANRAATWSAGLSTGGILAGTGGALVAWKGLQTAYKAWAERHQENLDRARKQASAASGVETRAALLQSRLNAELEKQSIRDIYAIEQKRAENAKALHLMKATNVASELKYQKEIFALEEKRYENEKKINRLKMAVQQHEQKVQYFIEEQEKVGQARDSAHIKRTWWRPDETVDANGNVISNSLAKAAGLRTLRSKATVDANFAALQEIARNVRSTLIASFKEGSDIFATRVSAMLDKASALGADAMSDELEKKINNLRGRIDSFEANRAANMNKINYDKLMRGELKPQTDKDGNVVFIDDRGQSTAESREAYRARVSQYRSQKHPEIAWLEKEERDLKAEIDVVNSQVEMRGHVQGVAYERIKQEAENRKKISEEYREKYISNTAETVSQFGASTTSLRRQESTRARDLHQKYALELVRGDAEATQKMRQDFALSNAEKEARDKSAEKFESEQRELASKKILEAGRLWIRSAERALQASLGIKEAQAELARKINQFQLDIELANADTYGKTIWETQKAVDKAKIGIRHQDTVRNINEVYINRERDEEKQIDKAKFKALKKLDEDQLNERMDLEKKLIDAQLEYRKAEIRFEYEYREQLEKAYNERRANDRRSWLQGVTKEEVKALIGVDKDVSELTEEEQNKLAQSRKAKAEVMDDLSGQQKEFGVEGQTAEEFAATLDSYIASVDKMKDRLPEIQKDLSAKKESWSRALGDESRDTNSENGKLWGELWKEVRAENQNQNLGLSEGQMEAEVSKRYRQRARFGETGLSLQETIDKYIKDTYGEQLEVKENGDVSLHDEKYAKAKSYREDVQWKLDHAEDIKTARDRVAFNAKEFEGRAQTIEENAAKGVGFDKLRDQRVDAATELAEMKARQTRDREMEEARFERRRKRKEGDRKIEKEDALFQAELDKTSAERYDDIYLENRARNDKFIAQQADIYNRGQIAQRNLATDNLVTAMQQNGGGYTNQMIKYGIQSEYESAKNEMEARHAAEKEQLESRGNVTEYERQELQNRQAMEASDLDNNKKLRDMMADRVMNANVGQKSGMAETWERIQASAFGHMKDPVEMAIDSLKENDTKNHDDLMSRLDQYLPAIVQNTAETDAMAVNQYNSYMSRPNDNPGLLSGMPNVRLA